MTGFGTKLWSSPGPSRYELATGESLFDRDHSLTYGSVLVSQTLHLTYFTAKKSELTSNVRVYTAGTAAAATPTLCRIGIFSEDSSGNLTLVGSIANDTTLFAATTTAYTRAITTPFIRTAGQRYAMGLLVVSGAATPNFISRGPVGATIINTIWGAAPRITGSVTGQADLPSSVAVGSINNERVHAYGELT